MYPNSQFCVHGVFVHEQNRELMRLCKIKVISPVPRSPIPIRWLRKKWRQYASIPYRSQIDGIEVYYPRYLAFPKGYLFEYSGWFYYWGIRNSVKKIYKKFKFDIIHAHVALPDGYGAMLVNRFYGKPLVVNIHGLDIFYTIKKNQKCRQAIKEVFRKADRIVTVSNKLAKKAFFYCNNLQKIKIINNGIALERIFQGESRLKQKYEKKKILLSVGDLIKRKGVDYIIRALPQVLKKIPSLVYLVIGKGSEEKNLKRLTKELLLENYIIFLGQQPYQKVMEYMSICDLFVLPSWNEGFGVVYLEAMAHNKPVIGCMEEGIEDVIHNGENGLLVKPKDVNSLREAILRVLENPEFGEQIGQRAGKLVREKFNWQKNAERVYRIYSELISENT